MVRLQQWDSHKVSQRHRQHRGARLAFSHTTRAAFALIMTTRDSTQVGLQRTMQNCAIHVLRGCQGVRLMGRGGPPVTLCTQLSCNMGCQCSQGLMEGHCARHIAWSPDAAGRAVLWGVLASQHNTSQQMSFVEHLPFQSAQHALLQSPSWRHPLRASDGPHVFSPENTKTPNQDLR